MDMRTNEHWDKFYKDKCPGTEYRTQTSPFAQWISELININDNIVDLGCGRGGDSKFLANITSGKVFSIDESKVAIDKFQQSGIANNIYVKHMDFIQFCENLSKDINIVYSRFTLHCINFRKQAYLLNVLADRLSSGGLLLIEVRSDNDPLYEIGEPSGPHSSIKEHYRCFVNIDWLRRSLESAECWDIMHLEEKKGWSEFNGDNPKLIRLIAMKR